jgi:threonine dehydratase
MPEACFAIIEAEIALGALKTFLDRPAKAGRAGELGKRGPFRCQSGVGPLEWEEDLNRLALKKLDAVLVAVGGGGLIAGVAAWFAGRAKVIGVEPEGSRALHAALEANAPVDVAVKSLAADSLGAKRVGELNFEIAKQFVSQVVLVTDTAIAEAQRRLWADVSVVTEPGGAAAYAALASGAYRPERNERVGVLVCGANADLAALSQAG